MSNEFLFEIEEIMTPAEIRLKLFELDGYAVENSIHEPRDLASQEMYDLDTAAFSRSYGVVNAPLGPPPWSVGFSKQFKKDTHAIDRKVMGRILEVLEELTDYTPPFEVHGDTFKPLKGELDVCWRYRIGDNRLVVQPVVQRAQINAIAFGARGSIYD